MPVTQDIRNAIEAGDKKLAKALYNEVLSKGLSGHDQQVLATEIGKLSVSTPAAEVKAAPKPKKRTARKAAPKAAPKPVAPAVTQTHVSGTGVYEPR